MKSFIIALTLWLVAAFSMPSVFADHNINTPGHNPGRGYSEQNCDKMVSKETGVKGEWLGHLIGCIIETRELTEDGEVIEGYVLIGEYKVIELDKDLGRDLILAIRNINKEKDTSNWIDI